MEIVGNMVVTWFLLRILKWLIIALITIIVLYFVIRAICRYQARQNAKAFDYDYLAERTAEEVCKRLVIIEKQKETAYKGATNLAGDQAGDETDPGQGGCSR